MGSLTLYINGLALCHLVDNDKSWKVFFPKADRHPFQIVVKKRFKVGSNNVTELKKFFIPIGKEFEIKTDGEILNESSPTDMINLTDLIGNNDLTLADVVSDDSKFSAKGTLYGFKLNPVYLKLHFPNYSSQEISNMWNYYRAFEVISPDNRNPVADLKVKNSLKSDVISTNADQQTILTLAGETLEILEHSDDSRFDIYLYNNCDESPDGCVAQSDFHYYYNILNSSSVKNVELNVIESPSLGDRVGCDSVILP